MEINKQNLLFVGRATQHAGTENVMLQLCEIFKPVVNKIVVCCSDGFKIEELDRLGIRFYPIPDIERKDPRTILTVMKSLRKIVKEENITIIHTHHRMAAFYISLLGLYRKCMFLNTSHNTFDNKIRLTQFAYRHARLIACGEAVKKNLVDVFGFSENQVKVIHNAVKEFEGEIVPDPLIAELHAQHCFVVGNVGRLSEQKGMSYFINAIPSIIKKHPEARFLIVGSGEDEAILKQLVEELDVGKVTFFMGYRSDVQNIMAQMDLVVLSSLWEGLPLIPIEAFSVGRTVVGTAVDGTVEIIEDQDNGLLIAPRQPEAIVQKVNWIIEHPRERERMEASARKKFETEFSFAILAKEYVNSYKDTEH